ncbi:CPBP family intramembrane metalloprotease [Rubrobacter marinus]|uniref:CPBP family intramembrane metalloprotease n=1 Tax=Rubrobacter marinus TaxID=2653852 RepID=A0A6G8Q1D0_9ACTN|nr:type II CAAX endopeptidase family protein [Rubrobacter marinus]QIN80276.1 CPBP family intramembrane metalloprotease [Rubrobacter marinus]
MGTVLAPIKRYPLIAFFVLAYALTWWVYPLLQVSPLLGLLGLVGPALAATIVVAVSGGRTGLKGLWGRLLRWRVGALWYAVAFGLPAALALAAAGLHLLLGAPTPSRLGELSVLELVIFVLIVGEELGWRGYALPRLLATRSALVASLVLGLLWSAWHLPAFFVPGTPQYGQPIPAFFLFTTAYSVLFAWIYLHTGGSVLIATLFHGAINFFQGYLLGGIHPAREYWLLAFVWSVAALVVVISSGTSLVRKPDETVRGDPEVAHTKTHAGITERGTPP